MSSCSLRWSAHFSARLQSRRRPPRRARRSRRAARWRDSCHRDLASLGGGPRRHSREGARARARERPPEVGGETGTSACSARRGRLVAGSASFGGNELASGFVRRGERLTIQACRFRGDAGSARVSYPLHAHPEARARRISVARRARAEAGRQARLQALGLDLSEHGDANSSRCSLHGRADARTLRRAGFRYTVRVADLAARTRRSGAATAHGARQRRRPGFRAAATSYRRLPDYDLELKRLAMQVSVARAAADARPPQRARARRQRDRDLDGRAEHGRRQAGLPDHGRAPRARVAVGGARRSSSPTTCCAATAATRAPRSSCARRARSSCRS